jgi:integrase
MMAELRKWRLACPPCKLELIFPNECGNPIDHGNLLRRHFYPALKKAQIPKIRFHDLRHTYASLLIEQGESIKYIQSQLGHANPMVTLSVYAHLMKSVNQEAPARLESTIFESNGSKMVAETKKGAMANAVTP